MSNVIALDWDSHELRAVIARISGQSVSIVGAIHQPLADDSAETIREAIRGLVAQHGLGKNKTRALVTIGRGKAELRQLNLPPVPENELPDMVRLQAMQAFAGVGENATIDYLPLPSGPETTSVLAAAVGANTLKNVTSIVEGAGLEVARVALRPVAAATLYQVAVTRNQSLDDSSIVGDVVLVDLLADDAEIVVVRGRRVMFVRSVRMPPESAERPLQIAGELRRSLMACGINASSSSQKVVIWGQAKTHEAERVQMSESLGCRVTTLDPMTLVDSGPGPGALDSHTGRFAPLIGLLVADAGVSQNLAGNYLVDFVNPRKAVEVKKDNRKAIFIGAAVAATALLAAYGAYSSLAAKDSEIAKLEQEIALLKPRVEMAQQAVDRTERIDLFLDGNVVWLDEIKRIAEKIPGADEAIIKSVAAVSPPREGGGRLTLTGAAMSASAVDKLGSSLRDETHTVTGSGVSDLGDKETYRWGFREVIAVEAPTVREKRYEMFAKLREAEATATPNAAVPPNAAGAPPAGIAPTAPNTETTSAATDDNEPPPASESRAEPKPVVEPEQSEPAADSAQVDAAPIVDGEPMNSASDSPSVPAAVPAVESPGESSVDSSTASPSQGASE